MSSWRSSCSTVTSLFVCYTGCRMAAENGQTRSSMGSSMSNSADIFNLMDNLLPRADCVEMVEPDELQRLYAGIGMPSLRAMELSGQARGVNYHEIREANPLLGLVDPIIIRNRYVELREQALLGDADAINDLGWFWLNGLRLKPNPAPAGSSAVNEPSSVIRLDSVRQRSLTGKRGSVYRIDWGVDSEFCAGAARLSKPGSGVRVCA